MAEDTASGGTMDPTPPAAEPGQGGESSAAAPDALGQAGASPAATDTPAQPVNKLHEWAAAIAIMIFLATIMGSFIWFLRGWSM